MQMALKCTLVAFCFLPGAFRAEAARGPLLWPEASGHSKMGWGEDVEKVSTVPTGKGLHLPPGEGVVGRLVIAASGWAP